MFAHVKSCMCVHSAALRYFNDQYSCMYFKNGPFYRLDKANLKCKEAEHIRKTYCQIKSKLEDEHKTFETQLDEMEQEIKRYSTTPDSWSTVL